MELSNNTTGLSALAKWNVFLMDTSMPGIKYTLKPDKIRRSLWIFFLLSLLVVFINLLVTLLTTYFAFNVSRRVTTVEENPMPFPAVTFCNSNYLRKSYVQQFPDIADILYDGSSNRLGPPRSKLNEADRKAALDGVNYEQWVRRASHRPEDMFMACYFQTTIIYPCSLNLTLTPTPTGGLCYTFNSRSMTQTSGRQLMVPKAGKDYSFRVTFNIEQLEYYYGAPRSSAGMEILVHDPDTYPLFLDNGVMASPGMETRISLTKKKVLALGDPYKGLKCRHADPIRDNFLRYHDVYSYDACREECVTNFTLATCQCRSPYQVASQDVAVCNQSNWLDCGLNTLRSFYDDAMTSDCGCFHLCEETSYVMRTSSTYWPALHIAQDFISLFNSGWGPSSGVMTLETLRQNYAQVRIYFETLETEEIQEIAYYPATALSADLGGNLGLYLGASIITLFEVVDFLIGLLCSVCKAKCSKSATAVEAENASKTI